MDKKRTGNRKESSSSSAAASSSSSSSAAAATATLSSSVVECSGRRCKSCSANAVGDCVALCCCPCSLVSILFLAFLKVPWVLGRGFLRRKRKNKKAAVDDQNQSQSQSQNRKNLFDEWEKEVSRIGMEGSSGGNWVAGYEAERVWLELYQAGQAGFGRVSFTT